MPKIRYTERDLSLKSLKIVGQAIDIIKEYTLKGYDLTLRQLYYQFVARAFLPNKQSEYKRLGSIINDARLMGYIDWDHITDRTRGVESISTWDSPASIIDAVSKQFKIDKWASQPYRVEVWIEKEALANVFERVCRELRLPYLSCRGYTSQSEMWRVGRRLKEYREGGQEPLILHFGDHDPSGIDMGRDIEDRVSMFAEGAVEFRRLALNMDQVLKYAPPPNPAKTTDSRFRGYEETHGDQSWELDALSPDVLADLVRDEVNKVLDTAAWDDATNEEDEHKGKLKAVSENWDDLTRDLNF